MKFGRNPSAIYALIEVFVDSFLRLSLTLETRKTKKPPNPSESGFTLPNPQIKSLQSGDSTRPLSSWGCRTDYKRA